VTVGKVFIDTAPIIYLLEDHPLFSESSRKIVGEYKEMALGAARLRAKYVGLKAMDSFQLACALDKNCSVFLTNDKQLRQVEEIECRLLTSF